MHNNKTLTFSILGVVVVIALIFDIYILMARFDLFGLGQEQQPTNTSPRSGPIILTSAERAVADSIVEKMQAQRPQPLSPTQLSVVQKIIQRMQNQNNK